MALAAGSSSIVDRMIRAARLEVPLYEEVEADTSATNQALTVVVIAAIASGIGAAIGASPSALIAVLIVNIINALVSWAVWSFVVYWVGVRLMGGTATPGEVLRTLGFAETPLVLLIFRGIWILGPIVSLAAVIWFFVASFIGTRQALDLDNGKTAVTMLIGLVGIIVVVSIVSTIFRLIFGLGLLVGGLL
jgi:hypothetical protein